MSRPTESQDLVAVIPAAGSATRVSDLPFSKCLYPLPVQEAHGIAIHTPLGRLLYSLQRAGADRALMVTRRERSDLIDYVANHPIAEAFPIAHVITSPTPSVPHSILRAVPFMERADVILAYPDIVFEPMSLPELLIARMEESGADVMLALVPTDRPDRCDTVELDDGNRVVRISVKSHSGLPEAWILAVWNSRFTEFLIDYVGARNASSDSNTNELQVSEAFVAAQRAGLSLLVERFPNGRFLDLGTPDALATASHFLSARRGPGWLSVPSS
ncbi:MAG TPA: hypothetical protein VMR74_08940 [Gammaproteobacteria bacterium]|nr:hypothetical protein [Gammaproteobacteria bacterium]